MYYIVIQHAADKALAPKDSQLRKWAKLALSKKTAAAEVTIRIVTIDEMTKLNMAYRHKEGATNVLSFPFTTPEDISVDVPILGDIVICTDVVNREANEQEKEPQAHWAHMVVHGIFHLLGYDHDTDSQAKIMETLEIETLNGLGFSNPYEIGEDNKYHE